MAKEISYELSTYISNGIHHYYNNADILLAIDIEDVTAVYRRNILNVCIVLQMGTL